MYVTPMSKSNHSTPVIRLNPIQSSKRWSNDCSTSSPVTWSHVCTSHMIARQRMSSLIAQPLHPSPPTFYLRAGAPRVNGLSPGTNLLEKSWELSRKLQILSWIVISLGARNRDSIALGPKWEIAIGQPMLSTSSSITRDRWRSVTLKAVTLSRGQEDTCTWTLDWRAELF